MELDDQARGSDLPLGSAMRPEQLDRASFDDRYRDWWRPDYWQAVLESQRISVPGHDTLVYGTTTSRRGTRWSLCLRPDGARRR